MRLSTIARAVLPLLCSVWLNGCETIGTLDGRAQSVNTITAKYAAEAVLYNIVRAKEGEPLNFVNIGALSGHNGFTGSVGLPTIYEGPGRTAAQRVFTFGPNTIGASESSDYTLGVVSDPQSYAALMRPVDTATIGFLLNMYYNTDTVLFLFISKIQVLEDNQTTVYENEPYYYNIETGRFGFNPKFEKGFYAWMSWYAGEPLSVAVDPTFVPAYTKIGNARFCFEDRENAFYKHATPTKPVNKNASLCSVLEESIYVLPYGEDWTQKPSEDQQRKPTEKGAQPPGPTAETPKGLTPKTLMGFVDRRGNEVRVYTRSVLGAYRYLGLLLNLRDSAPNALQSKDPDIFYNSPEVAALYVTHDRSGCWVSINYRGQDWCVPDNARETKRTFAMLTLLTQLYTATKEQQVTPTVRLTQ